MRTGMYNKIDSSQMTVRHIESYSEYVRYAKMAEDLRANRYGYMSGFDKYAESFAVSGTCYLCESEVLFKMDIQAGTVDRQRQQHNWREMLICPICNLNNRSRAAIHVFESECLPNKSSRIYMTEQTTRLYKIIKNMYSNTIGSEFLGDMIATGHTDSNGLRNENLTKLSFEDSSLDYILSFDVFEHVPDYKKGFEECLRCLKPGGRIIFTVPFIMNSENTVVRATIESDGTITHLLPAEYHGDPINKDGCLCYYHFGWDMLETLRDIGFNKAEALLYWSSNYGYLGRIEQIMFMASKGG